MAEQTGWIVLDGDATEHQAADPTKVEQILDDLDAKARAGHRPVMVHLYPATGFRKGPVLALGLGRDTSFIANGGSYAAGAGDQPTAWWYGNQESELPPGILIDHADAREAAREFIRTGQRPGGVSWSN